MQIHVPTTVPRRLKIRHKDEACQLGAVADISNLAAGITHRHRGVRPQPRLKIAYVVQVNLGGEEGRQPYILLNVDWFATQRRHPHCRDVHLVKLSEGFCQDEAMVPPF